MIRSNQFKYPEISRFNKDNKRYYQAPGENLPSVTTILDYTSDKSHLKEWAARIGHSEAKKITETSAGIGTILHDNLEKYILDDENYLNGNYVTKQLTKLIISKGLSNVSVSYGTEVSLYYEGLYAGSADFVGEHNGQIAIIDFKNARNERKEEWIENYFLQLVAYSMAHNKMFGTKIKKGVIMMATLNGKYQEFEILEEKYERFEQLWLDRLEKFYKDN